MFENLLHYAGIQKIIINTLFVSIPEEFYLVMFTLILVGEFEYWKEPECKRLINRFDYVRVFLPTIVPAILSETIRVTDFNSLYFQFVPFITTYILIIITNDIFGDASALRWMAKTIMFMLLGFLILAISEFLYVPFVLYQTDLTLVDISNNFLLYFTLSLPSRFLLYSLLLYLVSKKRTPLKGKLLKHILSNPVLSFIFSILVILNILFLQFAFKVISFKKVLETISHTSLFFILIAVVLFPIINISALLWCSYYIKNKEFKDKKLAREKLNILLKEIELFTYTDNYDNIKWKLKEIGMGIEEIAADLYTENETKRHR